MDQRCGGEIVEITERLPKTRPPSVRLRRLNDCLAGAQPALIRMTFAAPPALEQLGEAETALSGSLAFHRGLLSFSTYALGGASLFCMAPLRLTRTTLAVLQVLLTASPDNQVWGLRICMEADLGSGTVYPILDRLTELGWIVAREETDPHPGRPARRYYELTGAGRAGVLEAMEERRLRRVRLGFAGGSS